MQRKDFIFCLSNTLKKIHKMLKNNFKHIFFSYLEAIQQSVVRSFFFFFLAFIFSKSIQPQSFQLLLCIAGCINPYLTAGSPRTRLEARLFLFALLAQCVYFLASICFIYFEAKVKNSPEAPGRECQNLLGLSRMPCSRCSQSTNSHLTPLTRTNARTHAQRIAY